MHCTWGLFERTNPMNEADLCSECAEELYGKCRGAINCLLMYWTNRNVIEKIYENKNALSDG